MTRPPTPEELLGGRSGTSWKPQEVGDKVVGIILSQETKQQTEPRAPGKPIKLRTYDDGSPMWQVIFRLQTDEIDDEIEDDDGVRVVFASYELQKAITAACKVAGEKFTSVGGKLLCRVSGTHKNPYGGKPVKEYAARYKAGEPVPEEEGFDEPAEEPTPPPAKKPAKKAAAKAAPPAAEDDDDDPGF